MSFGEALTESLEWVVAHVLYQIKTVRADEGWDMAGTDCLNNTNMMILADSCYYDPWHSNLDSVANMAS